MSQIVPNGICWGREIRLGGDRGEGKGTGLRSSATTTTTTTTTVPFVSTDTSKIFCLDFYDFIPNFEVPDKDAEVSR